MNGRAPASSEGVNTKETAVMLLVCEQVSAPGRSSSLPSQVSSPPPPSLPQWTLVDSGGASADTRVIYAEKLDKLTFLLD